MRYRGWFAKVRMMMSVSEFVPGAAMVPVAGHRWGRRERVARRVDQRYWAPYVMTGWLRFIAGQRTNPGSTLRLLLLGYHYCIHALHQKKITPRHAQRSEALWLNDICSECSVVNMQIIPRWWLTWRAGGNPRTTRPIAGREGGEEDRMIDDCPSILHVPG